MKLCSSEAESKGNGHAERIMRRIHCRMHRNVVAGSWLQLGRKPRAAGVVRVTDAVHVRVEGLVAAPGASMCSNHAAVGRVHGVEAGAHTRRVACVHQALCAGLRGSATSPQGRLSGRRVCLLQEERQRRVAQHAW